MDAGPLSDCTCSRPAILRCPSVGYFVPVSSLRGASSDRTIAARAIRSRFFEAPLGHRYTLKVRSHKLKSPPQDGSDTEYTLLAVLKDEPAPAGTEFELALQKDVYLGPGEQANAFEVVNDSTFRYHEEIDVEVPAALRAEFNKVLAGTDRRGRFVFVDERRIRLVGFSA